MEYLTDRAAKLEHKIAIYTNHRKTIEDSMAKEMEQIQALMWDVQDQQCFEYLFSRVNILEDRLKCVREAEPKLLDDLANVRAIIAQLEWGSAQQAIPSLPSKATMLFSFSDESPRYPYLDSRYCQVDKAEQSRRSFSWVSSLDIVQTQSLEDSGFATARHTSARYKSLVITGDT